MTLSNKSILSKHEVYIDLLGPYPPPIGGISIHIKRLKRVMEKNGINCNVYDLGASLYKNKGVYPVSNTYIFLLKHLLFTKAKSIIHYHGHDWKVRATLIMMCKLRKRSSILSFHSLREVYKEHDIITKLCINLVLHSKTQLIVVSPKIRDKLISWGAAYERTNVIPAYIPPTNDELNITELPGFFHEVRKNHRFLITANAFRISFHNGLDLYGIDLCIALMKQLKEQGFSDVGFIYVIPNVGDYGYYQKMLALIKKYNLEECFHFYTKPVSYPAVINICDLFLRPTNTDGDSLSVRESLLIGRPTIASDASLRPKGTIIFKSRNFDDLYQKTFEVISNYRYFVDLLKGINFDDYAKKIITIYKNHLPRNSFN